MKRLWSSSDEEKEGSSDAQKIRICFKSQGGKISDYFEVLENAKMQDLIGAFCKKRNIEYKYAKFFFGGKRLPYRGTVAGAGLGDRDEIVVAIDQDGG